mgnify:CR=1 FL=1
MASFPPLNKAALWSWLNGALLLVGAVIVLWPLGGVVLISLHPPGAIVGSAASQTWSIASYEAAWRQGQFLRAFANSTVVALAVTALQIFTSALAGYALARFQFRGRRPVLLLVLAALIIPFQLLVVPVFLVLKWGHLINTYGALILPTAANGYGIFLMRQYFLTLPVELEEAAILDGATRWQILWRVMLPLARPALVTLFLFTFIGEWNDLFKPLIFTTRPELQTVQIALMSFQDQFSNDWPLLMAAAVIATVPVMVIFLVGQRQFIEGIATTGLKN